MDVTDYQKVFFAIRYRGLSKSVFCGQSHKLSKSVFYHPKSESVY